MKFKGKVILWGIPVVVLSLCILCGIYNRPYLTDPPQDKLDLTLSKDVLREINPTDLEVLYTLAREVVDDWASDAYLYHVRLVTPCENLTTPRKVHFAFLKINRLDIYTKQWYAFVDMDLEKDEIRLKVWKEEQDPTPSLQQYIDHSKLRVNLQQAIEIGSQIQPNDECREVNISLYQYEWDISYKDERSAPSDWYPGVKINALTGETEWREGKN